MLTNKVTWEQLEGEYKERLAKLELELSLLINQQSSLEDEGQIMWVASIMGNANHNNDIVKYLQDNFVSIKGSKSWSNRKTFIE